MAEAVLKKLSARRKKPAPVRLSKERRKALASGSVERFFSVVSLEKLRLPPSGPKP
jgi:hypothetical protein